MKKLLLLLIICTPLCAWGAKKPEPVYKDAVLKDFRTVQHGMSCDTSGSSNGSVNAHTDNSGSTNGIVDTHSSSYTDCKAAMVSYYTVICGDHEFVLTPSYPIFSGKGLAAALLRKNSSMYGVLPGTSIKMRSEGDTFYLKAGKKESSYKVVGMK